MEFPLYWGLQKTGLPLIVVTCTDDTGTARELCLLIDTGSTNNILFSFVYEHFQKNFKSLKEQGSIFSVLDVSDGMKHVQEDSGVQIHGVLGIHFLVDYEWIIDFNELKILNNNG